jgi:polo-like kinase 1
MNPNSEKDGKQSNDVAIEAQTIIEEKIVKVTGDVQIRKYIKGRLLGKGGFAKCYEATELDTPNRRVLAAKIVQKASLTKSRAK